MSSTGTTTSTSIVLRRRRLHDRRPARAPPRNRATSSTGRTVADSPIRCAGRSSSASSRSRRQRQVRAALGRRRPRAPRRRSPSRRRAAPRGPREVSSRNSDSGVVMRMSGGVRGERAGARRPGCRRCASPTVMSGTGRPSRARGLPDAGQRGAQVALDVDGQRLERRDVEHPAAPRLRRWRRGGEPVERPEERRQRLAGAGRRDDQGVRAALHRVPGARPGRRSARRTRPRTTPGWRGRSGRANQAPGHPHRGCDKDVLSPSRPLYAAPGAAR